MKCKCNIPALEKDASSLNHAYTLLSREFEPDRISHGGNVFLNCYYYDEDNFWRNLDDKRETHMASFEYEHLIQGDFFLFLKRCRWGAYGGYVALEIFKKFYKE